MLQERPGHNPFLELILRRIAQVLQVSRGANHALGDLFNRDLFFKLKRENF